MFNMAAKNINGNSGCINNSIESRIREVIIPLYSEFVEPYLIFVLSYGSCLIKSDKDNIEIKKRSLEGRVGHGCYLPVSTSLS